MSTKITTALAIFKLIQSKGSLASYEISDTLDMPKSTVSINIKHLLKNNLIRIEEINGSKRFKFKINEKNGFVAGIDVGQTHLSVAVFDLDGDMKDFHEEAIILIDFTPDEYIKKITLFLKNILKRNNIEIKKLLAIGIGVPAAVDYKRKILLSPPVMPMWHNYSFHSKIEEVFSCPVFVDNDVNIMALGEHKAGVGLGVDDFLLVKVATGIGMGIIARSEIYRGDIGSAGDIGHIAVENSKISCWCGNVGCLEAIAGGRALIKEAYKSVENLQSNFLEEKAKNNKIDIEDIVQGALQGDSECQKIVENSAKRIGEVLSKLVNALNPKLIVIDGQLARFGEKFLAVIREAIYKRSTPLATLNLEIKKSNLEGKNGCFGAAFLSIDELFSNKNILEILNKK